MKISILCSDDKHPVFLWLKRWVSLQSKQSEVELVSALAQLSGGDILFLISCHEIVKKDIRDIYKSTLVIHASDLPIGRGWSPHIWQILEGKSDIIVSLLEADDGVDQGRIWAKRMFHLEGHELYDEINAKLFDIELELMDFAVENFHHVEPSEQDGRKATYYRKRSPNDSEIDLDKTIVEQFELLRISDPVRFPAFIIYRDHKYKISLEKMGKVDKEVQL